MLNYIPGSLWAASHWNQPKDYPAGNLPKGYFIECAGKALIQVISLTVLYVNDKGVQAGLSVTWLKFTGENPRVSICFDVVK